MFLSNVAKYAFSVQMSTAHLPEIFMVKDIYHVSIFRKPEEAISSLINKLREHSVFPEESGKLDINHSVEAAIKTYDKYMESVLANRDNVHIVLFEDLASDYKPVIQLISDRFSLNINLGYESKVVLDKTSPIWSDKYDGHQPRDKDEIRLRIEEQVSLMDSIHLLTERYQAFLAKI